MKESKFVKTKIFAGYAILIAVCVLSVGYVYRTVVRFSTPDGSYSLLHTKRSVAGQTLYHLYQAESYGQLMIAGYQSYESRYKRELRTVRGLIDSLRGLTAAEDSLQTMRLDSIVRLLADKERRTMSLRRTIRSAATSSLLDKNIRELIGPADSAARGDSVVVRAADTVASRVVVQDTVTVPRRKRKFFRRFADLFSPPKEEAGMIISRHERVVDSLPAPEVKDTIAVVLRTLQDRVTSDRIGIYDRAWNEGMRLRYSNELVNTKIYRLIMDFEAEDTAFLMNRFEQTEAIRRRSSLTLGVIAVAAVVLMLLFVGILWRDINRSNRYRRALERANRDNEALLAAREKLMLAITHDIKAPLGSVMGYIDLLSRLTGDKREELYLHNMKESSEHLLALVNSLLDFYRLDINKVDVDKVAFCPAQLFETIRAGFAAQAGAKGIGLTLDVEPAAGREVAGDPFRIRQIADNLISNALKFTDEGSVTIRVGPRYGTRHRTRREGADFSGIRASALGAGRRWIRTGAVDRRSARETAEGDHIARKPFGRREQIHRFDPGGTRFGRRGPQTAACGSVRAGGAWRREGAADRRRSSAARNDRRDVPSGGCRSRVLSVPRICRETGRGRRLRRGADRYTDAVGRRFQRPCGGARREFRASRGGGFGTRGVGSRGFLGPRLCGMPAQALYG